MFTLDNLDLNGFIGATNQYEIRDEFEINESDRQFQWAAGPRGSALVSEPDLPNVEITLPMRIYGVDADDVAEAYGVLREKLDKVIAAAGLGGTDLTWTPKGATWDTTLKCYAGAMSARKYDHQHKDTSTADFTLTLIVGPYFMGPEYSLATGSKATGLPAMEVLIADAKGDAPGPARVLLDEASTIQRWAMLGMEHRNYRASTALTIKASSLTLGYSGTLTAAANEVQLCTRAGTISGGTFTLTYDGKTTTALAHTANAATIQAALEVLPNVGTGDWVVTGGPVSTTNVTFTAGAALAGRNLSQISITSDLTGGGTVTVSTTTPGTAGYVRSTLFTEWTTLAELTGQLHVGNYRVVAVVRDNATAADMRKACIRFQWGVGDLSNCQTGASVTPQGIGDVTLVSLGTVIIPEVKTGTQNWGGFIEVKTNSTTATPTLDVQDILLFPVELSFASTAVPAASSAGTLLMNDNFSAISGVITGDTSTSGHVWATMGGHTDADDFTQTAAPANTVIRTAVSDTNTDVRYGRGVILGAGTPTDVRVSVDISISRAQSNLRCGVIARFTDNDNFVCAFLDHTTGYAQVSFVLAGTWFNDAEVWIGGPLASSLCLEIHSSGLWSLARNGNLVASGVETAFASGTLASGKSGLYDWYWDSPAVTRTYSNFTVSIPTAESAVQHPGRGLTFGNGIIRESAAGGTWGPAPNQVQARPMMIGPAGPDGLSNRLLIATADQSPDLANTGAPGPFDWTVMHIPVFSFARYVQ